MKDFKRIQSLHIIKGKKLRNLFGFLNIFGKI